MENKGNEAVLTFSQYSIQIQEIQRFKTCWQCNKIQKISSKKLENWKSSQIAKSFKIFVDFWRLKIVLELVAHIWIYGSPILSSFNSYGWMRGSLASKLFIFLFKLKTGGEVLEKVVKKNALPKILSQSISLVLFRGSKVDGPSGQYWSQHFNHFKKPAPDPTHTPLLIDFQR